MLVISSDRRCPSRSWLGRSSPRERSRREAPSRGKLTLARPLARDISAGRASREAPPPAAQGRNRKVATTSVAASSGDLGRGHVGFGDSRLCSRVVSIAGSRQAARGPSRPGTKSLWFTGAGLAFPRESAGRAKERRKPDRRWQNREIGGGFPTNRKDRENDLPGNICRRKALWVGKAVLFDEGAVEAILVPHEHRSVKRVISGARQGASEVVR